MAFDNSKAILTLWRKVSQTGKKFLSGYMTINGERKDVVIFIGNDGDDRKPWLTMKESEPLEKAAPKKETPVDEIPF